MTTPVFTKGQPARVRWVGMCLVCCLEYVRQATAACRPAAASWLAGLLVLTPALAREVPAWQLVWSDEFNLPNGSAPDTRSWNYDVGGHGWGNAELQYYTNNRRRNARIEDGCLVIEAHQEAFPADGRTYDYTSARLHTAHKLDWTYGRVEARIRIPGGQGLWPAFWMLGSKFFEVGWPACGEIDIMENLGGQPRTIHASLHGPEYSKDLAETASYSIRGVPFRDNFHLFALDWEPSRIRISVDNTVYLDITARGLGPDRTWVFNEPFFVILNVAVGGLWPGYPDATTVFPQRMVVDYVRVYERTNAPQPCLRIETFEGQVALSWPSTFPHARLQHAQAIDLPWQDVPLTGLISGEHFMMTVAPGWYRLQ